MDVLIDHILGPFQDLAGQDHRRGGPVADLLILGFRDLDQHLRRGMFHVNFLEDRDPIVGDHDVTHAVHQHLVHPTGPEGRPNGVGDGLGGRNVAHLGALAAIAAGAFLQNQNWGCSHHDIFSLCSGILNSLM